jgi:hypothetical protein
MAVTTVNQSVQQTITDLNAGWYNAVARVMGLDQSTFVLAQGGLGLQTSDSSGLFLMSDSVPPSAAVTMYQPSGTSKLSSAYSLLLQALLPETDPNALRNELGDMYSSWFDYRKKYYSDPSNTQPQVTVFTSWANANLDPGPASRAVSVFKAAAAAPLNAAFDALADPSTKQRFTRPDGTAYSLYAYSATVDAAKNAINVGRSATIHLDSSTMDTTLSHLTAQGSATGFYTFFWGAAGGGSFDQLNQTASSSSLTIDGTIGQYAVLTTNPLGWFTSAEYTRAYNAKNDNTVWDAGASAGTWDSFFAQPDGAMARRVSSLVLVSDYQITVTSKASYSQSDFQQIQHYATGGFWPFFSASTSSTSTQQFQLNADGTLSVTYTVNKGDIEIWGVNVLPAPQ